MPLGPTPLPPRRGDPLEPRARELAIAAHVDPDSRSLKPGSERGQPAWCGFRDAVRAETEANRAAMLAGTLAPQAAEHRNAPLVVLGDHSEGTLSQMRTCMGVGRVVAGVLCADGHLGYAQPVGGVIAYDGQISISGVGFDIGCGNMAVRLDVPFAAIRDRVAGLLGEIRTTISFGIGRSNSERVDHPLLDDLEPWQVSGMADYRDKARAQLGTVGSGNHYVDLLEDEEGMVWIGVHFGSRGLGHTSAARYLALAGGKEGMHVAPALLADDSDLGRGYIAAMELAGRYAQAGREWVVDRVRRIVGGEVSDTVHNHHNYAWRERHGGRDLWVVRKGATPAFPGQRGFVGGSMGDDAVILEGLDTPAAAASLYSTIHGAGRTFGRMEAKRRLTRQQMDDWLRERGVVLAGGDLDESPMAYRRLADVLTHHLGSVQVRHRLRPFAVAMAGTGEFDPFKD
ncbi:MAG: uncharacterized protein JWR10_801 [Rubritepida sp.]|nr:uncharacterized protein [Rubritepida sp.]